MLGYNSICMFVLISFCFMAYQLSRIILCQNLPCRIAAVTFNLIANEFHAFPKGMNLKVNVIARVEFELAYLETAVQHFSHKATETPSTRVDIP